MARAIKVTSVDGHLRYARSAAHARDIRMHLIETTGLRKKDITIDEVVELPTKKDALIDFLNELIAEKENFEYEETEEDPEEPEVE